MPQALLLGLLVSLQLLCTLVGQILVFRLAGVGTGTDVYVAAQAAPMVISAIAISALQSVWLPRLSRAAAGTEEWRTEQESAQGQALILGGGLMLATAASAVIWIPLLFSGFSREQQDVTLAYSMILFVAAAFNTQSSMLTVALRASDRFVAVELLALSGTVLSLAAIYWLLPGFGILAAVWIALGRAIIVYMAQSALAGWPRLSMARGWRCAETWRQMRPLLFGASIYKTSPLVDRYWAAYAPAGGVTSVGLAQSAMAALSSILERSFCVPVMPSLSRFARSGDYPRLRETYRSVSLKLLLAVLAFDAAMLAFKPMFTMAVMAVLRVQHTPAEAIWMLCLLLSGSLFSSAVGALMVGSFYAMGDTATPVRIGTIGFAISIVVKSAGYMLFQLPGLCFAISLHYVANAAAMWWILEGRIRGKSSA